MSTFFPLGGVAIPDWGWYIPPNSQKFRLWRAKKKVASFSEVFYYVEKIVIPSPSQFWLEV